MCLKFRSTSTTFASLNLGTTMCTHMTILELCLYFLKLISFSRQRHACVVAVRRQVLSTVHRCCQADASKVTFPEFISDTIQLLAMKAVGDLGRYGAVEANLDKLLFCETGGHFMFHRNTLPKYTGVEKFYATDLSISLARHDKKRQKFDGHLTM